MGGKRGGGRGGGEGGGRTFYADAEVAVFVVAGFWCGFVSWGIFFKGGRGGLDVEEKWGG